MSEVNATVCYPCTPIICGGGERMCRCSDMDVCQPPKTQGLKMEYALAIILVFVGLLLISLILLLAWCIRRGRLSIFRKKRASSVRSHNGAIPPMGPHDPHMPPPYAYGPPVVEQVVMMEQVPDINVIGATPNRQNSLKITEVDDEGNEIEGTVQPVQPLPQPGVMFYAPEPAHVQVIDPGVAMPTEYPNEPGVDEQEKKPNDGSNKD